MSIKLRKGFLRCKEEEAYSTAVQQQNMRDWMQIFQRILDNPRANEIEKEDAQAAIKLCLRKLSDLIEGECEAHPAWISRREVKQ